MEVQEDILGRMVLPGPQLLGGAMVVAAAAVVGLTMPELPELVEPPVAVEVVEPPLHLAVMPVRVERVERVRFEYFPGR